MKTFNCIYLFFFICILSCNKDHENPFPNSFEVTVDSIDYGYASISWEIIDQSSTYDVILSDQELATAISANSFEFTNLDINKRYSGRIIATNDQSQRSLADFEFSTGTFKLNLKAEKYSFNLSSDPESIQVIFSWNQFPEVISENIEYRAFVNGNERAIQYGLHQGRYRASLRSPSQYGQEYRFTIMAEYPDGSLVEHLNVHIPQLSDYPEAEFNLTKEYIGYTSFVFQTENINLPATYIIGSDEYVEPNDSLTSEGHISIDQEKFIISEWPLFIIPDYSYSFNITVFNKVNDSIQTSKTLDFKPKELYRLPDEDLVSYLYNIKDQSINLVAYNTSDIPTYSTGYTGPTSFNVYINSDSIGSYQCYWSGSIGSASFPVFNGLESNTNYTTKVEVDYGNFEPDSNYEVLDIPLTTFKEFQITTDSVSISNDLDIYISNINNNSFNLTWKTDLGELYTCDPFPSSYEFFLYIDGTLYSEFDNDQNPVLIENLSPNTSYDIMLECKRIQENFLGENYIIETRTASTVVTTAQ